ncbi:MAG: hypothetical protein R2744_01590 [Bacteroidales bacterium]
MGSLLDRNREGVPEYGYRENDFKKTEEIIAAAGGKTIYRNILQTLYAPTQFYLRNGCTLKVVMEDFYDHGDDKAVYIKKL